MVTAKGQSGGLYPISACLVNARAGEWLNEGGAELACIVAHRVLAMLPRSEITASVYAVTAFFRDAMAEMMRRHGDIFTGVRQRGVICGWNSTTRRGRFMSVARFMNMGSGGFSRRWTSGFCSGKRAFC
jgi:putrescine aminotransferase